MHFRMLIDDPVVTWPELGAVNALDAEEEMKTYEAHGMPVWVCNGDGPYVVSLPEGSEVCMQMLEGEISHDDVLCVSVRPVPGVHRGWWDYLEHVTKKHDVAVVDHDRHDVLEAIAFRRFTDGLRSLEDAVDLVRSQGIRTSNEAMRTEKALTKAIELLRATGFRAPRGS
jgi:hypothetical protein